MSTQPKSYLTPEEYLAIERRSETKSEYLNGEMFAMVGASRKHNLIAGNIFGELRQGLKGKPCEAYTNDMRVRIPATDLYTYPDVVVVCGEPQFEDEHIDTLINPTLVIGVPPIPRNPMIAAGKQVSIAPLNPLLNTFSCLRMNTELSSMLSRLMANGY